MNTSPLRIERAKKGLTQADLARQAQIPHYRLSMYENGILKLKEEELQRLRKILGADLSNPTF